ncbi:MAG: SPOR domain-containing protein [Gemmatimonadaceae bacterium]
MFRWTILVGTLLFCPGTLAVAQTTARPIDPVFARAQTLVSEGNGAAGRALIDSMLAATPPQAPLYPQALFWRATLASNAADAESDYKHIVVDYSLAPQAADALLRLAQLELARGDRDGALAHLQRIPRDYPRSKLLARSSYWTARVLFEKNDIARACAANASALAQADTTEIELRNQIGYQGQRCPLPAVAASQSSTTERPAAVGSAAKESSIPVAKEEVVESVKPSLREAAATAAPEVGPAAATERPKPPAEANDAKPSIVDPTRAPTAVPEKTVTKPSSPAPSGSGYSVQVAAYNGKPDAEKLASTLRMRGYEARVDGSTPPFRVRIGRYKTSKEAEEMLRRVKTKQMEGFVVRAPVR